MDRVKEIQLDAQSVVLVGLVPIQLGQQSHLKRIISNKCCIHTVVPPDDSPRYTRNM